MPVPTSSEKAEDHVVSRLSRQTSVKEMLWPLLHVSLT
jgi:hypothetical protein